MKKNIKKMESLDVVFILDKSGSMSNCVDYTISSFNEYLEKERKNKFDTFISMVLFNDKYSFLYKRRPVKEIKNISNEDYKPGGCTALYDALGCTINYMDTEKCDKVLFVIISDGYENASTEWNKDMIKKLIKKHSKWEFVYIGADIDSNLAGSEIGIKKDNIAEFKKTKTGTSKLFKATRELEACMMDDSYSCNWKDSLK